MTLGTFQPRARVTGDKLNLQQYAGRPLLVRTMEFVPDFSSQAYPNPKPVVFADVVDLISGQIFVNVLWGAGAVVDNLKDKAGTEEVIPVKAGNVTSPKSGRNYIALFPLEGGELDAAVGWYNANWGHVNNTRAQRQAAAAAAAPAQTQQGPQFNPQAQTGANPQFQQQQQPAPQQFAQPMQQPTPTPQQGFQPVPAGPAQGYGMPNAAPQFGQSQPLAQPYDLHGDGSAMVTQPGGQGYAPPQQPQQFGQPQAAPAPQYQPQQPPQGFGAPQGGVFSDVPAGPPAGAPTQFAPPQGQDPAAASAALAHLNQQAGMQQPQG